MRISDWSSDVCSSDLSGRAELALSGNVSAEVRGTYSSGRVEFDGFNADSNDVGRNKEFVGYARLNFALAGGRFRNRVAFAYTDTNRDNFNPDRERPQSFEADGKNKRWEYQGSFDVGDRITAIFGGRKSVVKGKSVTVRVTIGGTRI